MTKLKPTEHVGWAIFWITLALRVFWAWRIPLTGDEAYYVTWGLTPALGYYDHPPMVGWWLAALVPFSLHALWLRLPAVFLFPVIALWARREQGRWDAAALLWVIVPLDLFMFAMVPDAPLVLFLAAFFGIWTQGRTRASAVTAGICLGGALLSKYFAWFLLPILGATLILPALGRRMQQARLGELRGLPDPRRTALTFLAAAPAMFFHLGWNSAHCWVNWEFNAHTRLRVAQAASIGERLTQVGVGVFWAALFLWPFVPALRKHWRESAHLWTVALAGFALVIASTWKNPVSIHYYLPYLVPLLVWMGRLPRSADFSGDRAAAWALAGNGLMSGVLALGVTGVLLLPMDTWKDYRIHRSLVLFAGAPALARQIESRARDLGGEWIWASDGYTSSAMLEAARGRDVVVLGWHSHWGRQDDYRTDFRRLDGKSFLIFSQHVAAGSPYGAYFQDVKQETITLQGQTFYLWVGKGFRFADYAREVMSIDRRSGLLLPCARTALPDAVDSR
ncbi:MAG: ArnT family glycosyltransferase [Bacteriovoracia bacterium]